MKKRGKLLAVVMAVIAAAAMSLVACKKPAGVTLPSLSLSETEKALTVGESFTLTATLRNSDAAVEWSVDAPEVAGVDNGVVTAYAAGAATVTATAGTVSATCRVTVSNVQVPVLDAGITSTKVYKGLTREIQNAVVKLNGVAVDPQPTFTYTSRNTNIATVSDTGVITGVAVGNTTVTVSTTYNEMPLSKTFDIAVEELTTITMAESVEISHMPKIYSDDIDNSAQMAVTGYVDSVEITAPSQVNWSVDNDDVVEVSDSGLLTAKAEGTAILTASHGTVSETCTVSVVSQKREQVLNDLSETSNHRDFNAWGADSGSAGFVAQAPDGKAGDFYKASVTFENTGEMSFQIDYGNTNYDALLTDGYTQIVVPIYLEYIGTVSGESKGYQSLRFGASGDSTKMETAGIPGNPWTLRQRLTKDAWTDVTLDIGELKAFQTNSGGYNILRIAYGNKHEGEINIDDGDNVSFVAYIGTIVARRTFNTVLDTETVLDTTVEPISQDTTLNGYVSASWNFHPGFGKINDDNVSYMMFTHNTAAWGNFGYEYKSTPKKNAVIAQMERLLTAGYNTLRIPVYTIATSLSLTPTGSVTGVSAVALTPNDWTNIDISLSTVKTYLESNSLFFKLDTLNERTDDYSVYVGKVIAVKTVAA